VLKGSKAFSSFSVDDLSLAKQFYGQTLGLEVTEESMGIALKITGESFVYIYQKDSHVAATYTCLNFPVEDIDRAVDELANKGVVFEHYENVTDKKGIARGISAKQGPDIAWFKDPAGNFLSVLHDA